MVGLFVCLLLMASCSGNMQVYLRAGSARRTVRAATLRHDLQIKLAVTPNPCTPVLGQKFAALASCHVRRPAGWLSVHQMCQSLA